QTNRFMSLVRTETCVMLDIPPQAAEQRRHARFMCIDAGVLRLAVRPEFKGRRGLVMDVSTGGIGFILQEPLEPETVLVFELRVPGGPATIGRIARVCHSRPHEVPADAP